MATNGAEFLDIPEVVIAEYSRDLNQLITGFGLNEFVEAVGQPSMEGGLSKWDEVVEPKL